MDSVNLSDAARAEFRKEFYKDGKSQFFTTTMRQKANGELDIAVWPSPSNSREINFPPFANRNGGHIQMAKIIRAFDVSSGYEGRWFGGGVVLDQNGKLLGIRYKSGLQGVSSDSDNFLTGEARELFKSAMLTLFGQP